MLALGDRERILIRMTHEWRNAGIGVLVLILIAGGFSLYSWYSNRGGEPEAAVPAGEVAGASDDGSSTPDGMPITNTVKLNTTVRIAGTWINPVKIEEDSRCAEGTQCIQAGTLRVGTLVTPRNGTEPEAVIFALDVPMTVGMDQVTLTKVMPAKTADGTISPESYVFTFTVTKGAGTEYYKG